MNFIGKQMLGLIGIHHAEMSTEQHDKRSYDYKQEHLSKDKLTRTNRNEDRYSPVPAIPVDIAYHSGKETGGSKSTGVMSNAAGNPAVIIGLGLTTMALLGMIRKSAMGDKLGTQKYMQYRIMAQFFTVTALVAGVTIFGGGYFDDPEEH